MSNESPNPAKRKSAQKRVQQRQEGQAKVVAGPKSAQQSCRRR
ncbi:MAG: hypothetical protein R2911_08350 [Caldilineaceae bacterium]